jgi:hypothetical protein
MGVGKIRFYNGPQSPLMDKIYDDLIEHIDVSDMADWPIISLHLARVVAGIRKSDIIERCTCWKCMGMASDPYAEVEENEK